MATHGAIYINVFCLILDSIAEERDSANWDTAWSVCVQSIHACRLSHSCTLLKPLVPINQSINQSNLVFVKRRLNKVLRGASYARLELFATNTAVLEMRWQHVPNLGCCDAETARTITRGPSTWYNHVIVVSRAKPGMVPSTVVSDRGPGPPREGEIWGSEPPVRLQPN